MCMAVVTVHGANKITFLRRSSGGGPPRSPMTNAAALRCSLFCVCVTRRILVDSHRRFGTTYRYYLYGQTVLDCLTVADGHRGVEGTVLTS
jgi:hypothetical protein